MSEATKTIIFPVTYNDELGSLLDSIGEEIAPITYGFDNMDDVGEYIAAAINEKHEREKE